MSSNKKLVSQGLTTIPVVVQRNHSQPTGLASRTTEVSALPLPWYPCWSESHRSRPTCSSTTWHTAPSMAAVDGTHHVGVVPSPLALSGRTRKTGTSYTRSHMQAHYICIPMLDDARRCDITIAVLEVIRIAHCITHLYASAVCFVCTRQY